MGNRRLLVRHGGVPVVVWLALASLAAAVAASPSHATGPAVEGSAAAHGFRVTYWNPEFALESTPVDGGGPTAQASSEFGAPVAFAALPYPGEFGLMAPGLAAGAAGVDVPTDYPLIVEANDRQQEAEFGAGPYSLLAQVSDAGARARAALTGVEDSAASSVSQADLHVDEDGTVVATAGTRTTGIVVGPLEIGTLTAKAVVVRERGQAAKIETEFALRGASVADMPVGLENGELVFVGGSVPLQDMESAQEVLEAAGVDVMYRPEEHTERGAVSAGLEIRLTNPVSLPSLPEGARVSITVGQVSAFANEVLEIVVDDIEHGLMEEAQQFATVTGPPGSATDLIGEGDLAAPMLSEADQTEDPGEHPAALPPPQTASPQPVTADLVPLTLDGLSFYFVIVVGGVACFGGLQVLRLFGVRRSL